MSEAKGALYGLELELITLDQEGKLVNGAPEILKAVESTGMKDYVTKEISKCMLEVVAKEKPTVEEGFGGAMETLRQLTELSEKLGYRILALGTHPGRQIPKLFESVWYASNKAVLGDGVFTTGRVCGFHFHYNVPKGIMCEETKSIQRVGRLETRRSFISLYNFLVACDPAILTFCQSSPFWMGEHWAKDCRVLSYRDMKARKSDRVHRGIYYYFPMLGSLPDYEFTIEDIRVMADQRKTEYLRILEQNRFPTNEIAGSPALKFMWGPLRVNRIGTFEYRGPDMNRPSVLFDASKLLFHALEAIERAQLRVAPSDIGIEEPFALENGKIYVPPRSTLSHLEQQSVINGFESQDVHNYCSRLFDLLENLTGISSDLEVLSQMLDNKKSVSDDIIQMVKKNGYKLDEEVPEDMLNHIALYEADKFASEVNKER